MLIYASGTPLPGAVRLACCAVKPASSLHIAANRCESILNRFPLLLVASRCVAAALRLNKMQIYASGPGAVRLAWCAVKLASSLQIAANRC